LDAALAADLAAADTADTPATDAPPAPLPAPIAAPAAGGGLLDISLILDAAAAAFDATPAQSGAHDPQDTGFTLQQLELHAGANVDPYFRLDANLVFAEFGVEVEEAYGTTLALPAGLQLRAGQFLTRFGRHNATHPHAWHFADQPLVNGKFFGGEGSRGLGVELSWLSPLPWYVELVASATHATGECCARSFHGGDALPIETPADLLYTTAIKQFFALGPALSLAWGLSAQLGPNSTGQGNRTEIYGTDLYLHFRRPTDPDRASLALLVEALYRTREVPFDRLADHGGQAQLVWTLSPLWATGLRYGYVSGLADDPLDPEWQSGRHRASAQLTYTPSHFSRLRLQYNHDRGGPLAEPVNGVIVALELLVGAHGAHAF
ncbi:MAG: zinc-regulated TonB-dependent outer membrane receptor, partial [Myxococcales bacterium]|nr:zinc-regulated TonB-dependent outer membrane receptor [Myxococcales bacterium]